VLLIAANPSEAKNTPPPLPASSLYQLQVGYADSFHSTTINFPRPWAGDPGVTFSGCNPCVYDGGAMRVLNTSSASLTVDQVTVSVGGGPTPCNFDLWAHNQTIPAGGSLVLAQTISGTGKGCGNPADNFDTSDMGIDGVNWDDNCTVSGLTIEVDVTVTDPATSLPVTTSFMDTGHILNTGGFDLAKCPDGTNESSPWWIPIGQTATNSFVISDLVTSSVGSGVTFWGSQWAKANLLGQTGVNGFKGFTPVITVGMTCGSTWQATGGNSPDPPDPPLSSPIPIIVTGPITKVGAVYQGTIEHILLVTVDPGYAGNPGHHGTGTVLTEVC
jgi:hypothetical protein